MDGLSWHSLALNPLAAFGLLLLLGAIGGQVAARIARLPSVTGYILTGLVIGPAGLGLVSHQALSQASLFVELALGLALFEIGRRIDLHWLRRETALLTTSAFTSLLVFVALYALLLYFGLKPVGAALLAAIGVATSPAVILEIVRETHAEGQVSERLTTATGLNTLFALMAFGLALVYSGFTDSTAPGDKLLSTAWLMLGSATLGLIAGMAAIRLNAWFGGGERQAQQVLLFALIALVVGVAELLETLPAMALLVFGVSTQNLKRGLTIAEPDLIGRSHFFFVAFFVASGALLSPVSLAMYWPVALLFVLIRLGVGIVCWLAAARFNGLTLKQGALVGTASTPLSGGAFTLLLLASPVLDAGLATGAMLAALCILELIGPVLTRLSLRLAGETRE
ncbi:cation:proton antiporter [Crenobacter cavernae]|uniref:Sodium:proton antiporter n=1 Tax=Crenobacter cavernae TaxID=2290923 RepID=A0A345Y816_9NEIS|nr:cation:proton antiporter [Crenobacter cavernae]AXK40068.1 sodium:proton antiporter [Crenobacter cavernae]RXZ42099.1 sodium:proton antiporter [Crenobacter cavernae]